ASILNPNVQEFKAQKKCPLIEQALTIRNFKQQPPATKSHNQHKKEKFHLSPFKNKIYEV
ncbi:TPA: hypothetical protein ACMDSS_003740, partial [Vibrio parahaemolyticus]